MSGITDFLDPLRHKLIHADVGGGLEIGAHGPVLLGYAQVVDIQGSIVAETDVTGLSVTVTVPTARSIRVTWMGTVDSSVAGDVSELKIQQDGVDVQRIKIFHGVANATNQNSSVAIAKVTPSAGTHTYKIRMSRSSGTGTHRHVATSTSPSFILVEDITGVAIPAPPASVPVGVLAQAVSTGSQALSTLTALTIIGQPNIVVPAGRTIKVSFGANSILGSVTDNKASLFLRQDGAIVSRCEVDTQVTPRDFSATSVFVTSPVAGAHTYRLDGELTNGSGTVTFADAFIVIEDITATPASTTQQPSSTLGYAETIVAQTGISGETDLTSLKVTVTVAAGRRLRISVRHRVDNDATAGEIIGRIKEGATELTRYFNKFLTASTSADAYGSVIVSPSAGSHTYKATLHKNAAGTVGTLGFAGFPAFILVEDITGVSTALPIPTGFWAPSNEFPSNPGHGDIFYERDTDTLWVWNGTNWKQEDYAPVAHIRGSFAGGATTSTTYVDMPGPVDMNFYKRSSATVLLIILHSGGFQTLGASSQKHAVRINNVDHEVCHFFFNTMSQHHAFSGMAITSAFPAGNYTARLRWLVGGQSGHVDANDFYNLTIQEIVPT